MTIYQDDTPFESPVLLKPVYLRMHSCHERSVASDARGDPIFPVIIRSDPAAFARTRW